MLRAAQAANQAVCAWNTTRLARSANLPTPGEACGVRWQSAAATALWLRGATLERARNARVGKPKRSRASLMGVQL